MALGFQFGVASVRVDGHFGLIDTEGHYIIEPIHERLTRPFKGGYLQFLDNTLGSPFLLETQSETFLMGSDGSVIAGGFESAEPVIGGMIIAARDRKFGAIDQDGNVLIPFEFDRIVPDGFQTDEWAVYVERRYPDVNQGYIDRNGAIMIPAQFEHARPFIGDTAQVRNGRDAFTINRSGARIGGKDGCQDGLKLRAVETGIEVVAPDGTSLSEGSYLSATLSCGDPTRVCIEKGRCNYIDANGEPILDRFYERAYSFVERFAAVSPEPGLVAFIDANGDYLMPPTRYTGNMYAGDDGGVQIDLNRSLTHITRDIALSLADDPRPLQYERPIGEYDCPHGVTIRKEAGETVYRDASGAVLFSGNFDFTTCIGLRRATWMAISDRQEWCMITVEGEILEDTCRCTQPLAIIEMDSSPRSGPDCYPKGLEKLIEIRKATR